MGGGKGLYGWMGGVVYRRVLGERVIGRGLYSLQFAHSFYSSLWFFPETLLFFLKVSHSSVRGVSGKGHCLYLVGGPKPPQS